MKKLLIFLFFIFFIGCSNSPEKVEKDKAFLKNPGLMYDRLLLDWNEPIEVTFLNSEKFIAVWNRGDGLISGYRVRVLFYKYKIMGYSIQENNLDQIISKELSISLDQ